jgi:hypothetical protein
LAELSGRLQQSCGVTLTHAKIIGSMTKDEVAADLRVILDELEKFATYN